MAMRVIEGSNCVASVRVSTSKQSQEGESLNVQEGILRKVAAEMGLHIVPDGKVWHESFSGRKAIRPIYEEIKTFIKTHPGRVKYYLFRSIDRFTRGGTYSYETMKRELIELGVEMIDTNGIIQPQMNTLADLGLEYDWSRYSPSAITESVMAHTANAEVRDILTRLIGQEIRLRREGYKIRPATDGFKNQKIYVGGKKRTIEVPDPERAKYFIEIFNLRALGTSSDDEIVQKVNAMGYRSKVRNKWDKNHETIVAHSGGLPLTIKQLQRIILKPIYAGIICEQWTNHLPIKAQYNGLVSVDTFNGANRGKIHIDYRDDSDIKILYDYYPEKNVKRRMRDNPLFPYKWAVLCDECGKPFLGSSPSGKSGKGFPTYHCGRKHQYIGITKKTFDDNVENFINNLEFDPDCLNSWEASFLNKFREREKEIVTSSADIHRSIAELKGEQASKIAAIVGSNSLVVKRKLEEEVDALETQIGEAKDVRNKLEITESDIKAFVKKAKYMMEHPAEMLLNAENPLTQRALFGLVFEEMPRYTEIINGTPKLTWVFKLSSKFIGNKSQLVAPAGIEPAFAP
jgi:DNA invertase Pin-like site-specific DNA recombinase